MFKCLKTFEGFSSANKSFLHILPFKHHYVFALKGVDLLNFQ